MTLDDANHILKEDYLPALGFSLAAAARVFHEDYDTTRVVLKLMTRRQRMRRRVRNIRLRLALTWDVLRHGSPDDW